MRMIIGTSLCVFRKEEKHGTSLPPELGCDQVIGVDMEVDVDLLIHATSRALEPQFRAEEPLWRTQQHVTQGNGLCCLITQLRFLHLRFPGSTRDSSPFLTVRVLSCSQMGVS